VPHGEFVADVEAGRLAPGPTVRATWDRGYFDSPHLTDEDRKRIELATSKGVISRALVPTTLWQRYVERFILKYELNDEQAQRARRVLADCDAAAEKVARKTEARWNETQAKLKEAIEASDGKRALALRNEIKTLNEPIEKIFEDRLKPGLEKIPTRAQRQKADAADPADKPPAKPAARP